MRAAEAGSLLPVAPQFPWRFVRPQIQRRQLQQRLYLFGCLSRRAIPMVAKRERDVFSDAQMMEQPPALEHQAEAEPRGQKVLFESGAQFLAEYPIAAAHRSHTPHRRCQQTTLAGSLQAAD